MSDTIKVEALKYHTYEGKAYQVGDTYDFRPKEGPGLPSADQQVEALQVNGFATRVDRVEVAKKAAKQAEQTQKAQAKRAVEPMSTDAVPAVAKPAKDAKAPRASKKK